MALTEQQNELWKEAWKLHKAFSDMENTGESWAECAKAANEIFNRFGKTYFAFEMLSTVYHELERTVGHPHE